MLRLILERNNYKTDRHVTLMSKTFLIFAIIFQDLCLILGHQIHADSDANIAYIRKSHAQ